MRLDDLLETIINSKRSDWTHIPCWGAFSGPSYRDSFSFYGVYEGQKQVLHHNSQPNVAIYIPDIAITMAFGLDSNPNFKEPWIERFTNSEASSSLVDVFHNGVFVFRSTYVNVDGGKAKLPMPKLDTLEVPDEHRRFVKLLDFLEGGSQFAHCFNEAGFMVTNDKWPLL